MADRRLTPDHKTIANFRKDNGPAIRNVCRQFVVLCQQLGFFTEAAVAIDGSKFKAVNNRDRNFTSTKLQHPEPLAAFLHSLGQEPTLRVDTCTRCGKPGGWSGSGLRG